MRAARAVLPDEAGRPTRAEGKPAAQAVDAQLTINGRFYGQAVTGVQRYGREIVAAIDGLLADRGRTARLAVPAGTSGLPAFRALATVRRGPLSGHLWEQVTLSRGGDRLLNLCNTGPVLARRQVVCLHDTHVFAHPESYRATFRLFYRALQPPLARCAASVATVSHASARALARQFGLDRDRIAVLPNGHEHALRWRPHRARLPGGSLPQRPFVLVLGSPARHKNVGLLLGLAEALDACGLDLAVTGTAASIFAVDDTAATVQRKNLHWLGRVGDDDLALLLSNALCLAFPSFTEGFGLPIVEAMVWGCPVIAADRASMPEVCGDAALMASPDDRHAWLGHIRTLHGSPGLREELGGRGRVQARRFSWAASARGYLELLDDIA